jgi:hypothetical protein
VTNVAVPDEPPALTERGARTLLQILIDQAERELGPDWRARLGDDSATDR